MAGLSPDLGVPKTAEFLGYVVSIYKKKKSCTVNDGDEATQSSRIQQGKGNLWSGPLRPRCVSEL